MLVFPGSMNFTSHPGVLIAPRAPIDPNEQGLDEEDEPESYTPTPQDTCSKLSHGGLKTNNKTPQRGRSLVILCFNILPSKLGALSTLLYSQ